MRDLRVEDYAQFHSNLSRRGIFFRETWQFGFRNYKFYEATIHTDHDLRKQENMRRA